MKDKEKPKDFRSLVEALDKKFGHTYIDVPPGDDIEEKEAHETEESND